MKIWKLTPNETKLNIRQQDISNRSPTEGEVSVRIHAASLNKRDLMVANGTYPDVKENGLIPLSDGAGEIIAIGKGVNNLCPGGRVVNLFWRDWMDARPLTALRWGAPLTEFLLKKLFYPHMHLSKSQRPSASKRLLLYLVPP